MFSFIPSYSVILNIDTEGMATIVTKVTKEEVKDTEEIRVTMATGEVTRTEITTRTGTLGIVGVTTRITGEDIEEAITK